MAQPAGGLWSTFGFQCCLFFLLASWEFAQRSPDLPRSTESQKPKRHCSTTRSSKPVHNPETIGHKNATIHHHTSEQNISSQGQDPMSRSGRSINHATSPTTRKSPPVNSEINMKISHRTPRTPGKSEVAKDDGTTSASDRPLIRTTEPIKEITSANEKVTGSHSITTRHVERVTLAGETTKAHPMPTVEHEETTLAGETTKAHPVPTVEHEGETTLAGETTKAHPVPTVKHEGETTLADEATRTHAMPVEHGGKTTLTHEKITHVSENSTAYPEETTTPEKATRIIENPTIYPKNTTLTTKMVKTSLKSTENPGKTEVTETTRPPVKITGDKSSPTTCLYVNKTEITHQVLSGSSELTTSSILSKTPGNQSLPYPDIDGSQGGLHAGVTRENDSFPAWAIVIVVLVAVILLLVFLGLVFMVSCMTRARHTLTRNAEDNDPEDNEGPNSYPVYLMEQQNLQMSQIPSPQ
ncbi:mucin-like protein 3 [Dipodomys spectabilis]|uniref:mucin-like protein 3 n=1 Tax=Dipodomys spectabilis TaxID=105255 RepID=UPI001C53691E|nr:mucin-like protein 3 [Dipodomys spectabilis]